MVSSAAAARVEETTPLLSRIVDTPHVPEKKNTTKLIYSYVFGLLLLLVVFIYNIRSTLPTPLSDVQARELNDFPGIHCYNEYLSHFNQPHSANQRNNQVIKDWIVQLAHEFKMEAAANGVHMEIIEDDPTDLVSKRNKFSTDEFWMVESRNVVVRLTGKSNNTNESFLVNAHYDSVSTSHGVTDNGMGTAVAIELLRYFVQHPPQHTVIFLFNNFEEGGLIGADAFVQHPWFSTIKLFVNLEGTGAGGRALLFRSNTLAAVHGLASSGARLLHASPLGNDLLQAKLLKSDTDYTTFTKHGVPGLDIAFYTPRSHYHTQRDDLAHTTPESLQHMGQMALGSVLSIDNSDTMLDQAGAPEPVIYYDILGRVMLVYSFFTCQLINMLALFCVPLGLFTWFWFSTTANIEAKKALLKHNLFLIGKGFVATLAALAFMVVFTAFFAWIMILINPSATYGSVNMVVLYLTVAAFLGLVSSQWVMMRFSRSFASNLASMQVGFYGLTGFWWLLLVFATYLGSQKVAAVYFAVYFLISSTLATVLLVGTPPKEIEGGSEVAAGVSRFWSIAFLIQVLMPVILMTEFLLLGMDSMRHTSADGTPEGAIYVLLAAPIILIVLHLLPWVHAAGELQKTTCCTVLVFVVFFIASLLSSPFDGKLSPNRILFTQEYNATEALSTVALITGSSFGILQRTMKSVLPASEYDTMECESYLTYQTRCTYQSALTPVYGRRPEKEIQVFHWPTICDSKTCSLNITTTVENSLLCQLQFSNPKVDGLQAWINGKHIQAQQNDTIHALTVYSKKQASTVHWDLSYDAYQTQGSAGEAQFSCIYDDWTQGELPAFTTLRDNLPYNALLTIRGGVGLAKVHYSPSIPL
ncbi:hypothetical protein PS15p_200331 [Mucor circinelloides]